jgi:hypothetical protein
MAILRMSWLHKRHSLSIPLATSVLHLLSAAPASYKKAALQTTSTRQPRLRAPLSRSVLGPEIVNDPAEALPTAMGPFSGSQFLSA